MKPTLAWIGPKVAGPYAMKQNIFCKFRNLFTVIGLIYSNCREASSQEEFCKIPRTRYVDIGKAADPELANKMYKNCMKNHLHPSVHICKKLPKKGFARKTHRRLKRLLIRLKKRERRMKSQRKNRKGKKQSGNGKTGGRQSGKRKIRRGKKRNREATASHILETLEI